MKKILRTFLYIIIFISTGTFVQSDEIKLSPVQIKQYQKGLADSDIKIIRNFFNTYLSNKRKTLPQNTVDELDKHDFHEVEGLFILIEAQGFALGGKEYTIMFQKKPNAIFVIWVKDKIVKHVFDKIITPEAKQSLTESVGEFLKSPEYGI